MARRKKSNRGSFQNQRNILEFRPHIDFIEPDQIDVEGPKEPEAVTVDAVKERINNIIASYNRIEQLSDVAQKRIDQKSKGFAVNLDPVVDATVIASMKRLFPDKKDPTTITFDDYRQSLKNINEHAENKVSVPDLNQTFDPRKTSFAGLGKPNGSNRPELDQQSQIVEPINIPVFQAEQVVTLFNMMKDLITDLIKDVAP